MQLVNNSTSPGGRQVSRRTIIISSIVIVLVVLSILLLVSKHITTNPSTTGIYVDPHSHETVSNPAGKTPETYGTNGVQPVFLGVSKLIDYGITTDQVTSIENDFSDFATVNKIKLNEVSIWVDKVAVTNHDRNSTDDSNTVKFPVTFNRTINDTATIIYHDSSDDISLYIYDETGKTVYDPSMASPVPD